MKNAKHFFVITFMLAFILSMVLFYLCCCSGSNIETQTTEYLQNKYHQDFIRVSEIDKNQFKEKNIQSVYTYYLKNNPNIIFEAGKKKEKNIFPFSPPATDSVFFDNFFEAAKEYYLKYYIGGQTFFLENKTDIAKKADTIFNIMKSINAELNELGFETTNYSCSITINVSTKNYSQNICFYVLDLSSINNQLMVFYNEYND